VVGALSSWRICRGGRVPQTCSSRQGEVDVGLVQPSPRCASSPSSPAILWRSRRRRGEVLPLTRLLLRTHGCRRRGAGFDGGLARRSPRRASRCSSEASSRSLRRRASSRLSSAGWRSLRPDAPPRARWTRPDGGPREVFVGGGIVKPPATRSKPSPPPRCLAPMSRGDLERERRG
jgi:hypothetical protein